MPTIRYVLDASAVLAALNSEPGGESVEPLLRECLMSAVNVSEVIAKLMLHGASFEKAASIFEDLNIAVVDPFTRATAYRAAQLYPVTHPKGLSLGDRACLATAWMRGVPALTTDRVWGELRLPEDLKAQVLR